MHMPKNKVINRWIVAAVFAAAAPVAPALDSDRDQPAIVDADEVDMDFRTGVRTYRGDVYMQQGSIRLKADIVVVYTRDGKLTKATATGQPAVFRQRPEGKQRDVIGKGIEMILDQTQDTVTLITNASVEQEGSIVTGKTIEYNMGTEQVKIRGGHRGTGSIEVAGSAAGDNATGDNATRLQIPIGAARPRIVIPARTEGPSD